MSTGWLRSAAVLAGETISLKLMIWDTHDHNYDSTVLVDHLHWLAEEVAAPSTERAPPIVK